MKTKNTVEPTVKLSDTLVAMVERLKATKVRQEADDRKCGYAAGQYWAERKADFQTISAMDDNELDINPNDSDYGWAFADSLAALIHGHGEYTHDDVRDLKEYTLGSIDRSYSEEYVWGFIEGALAKYREVADKI